MQALPPYPSDKEIYRRLVVAVPEQVGMVHGARIALEWSDDGTMATLIVGGKRVSHAQAGLYSLVPNQPAKFVRRGRDWFLTFWTGCATCVGQNYVLLRRRSVAQMGSFENAWAPRFKEDGLVYAYPRHPDYDEQKAAERKLGHSVWIQEASRWKGSRKRFVPAGHVYLLDLPPIPRWRLRQM